MNRCVSGSSVLSPRRKAAHRRNRSTAGAHCRTEKGTVTSSSVRIRCFQKPSVSVTSLNGTGVMGGCGFGVSRQQSAAGQQGDKKVFHGFGYKVLVRMGLRPALAGRRGLRLVPSRPARRVIPFSCRRGTPGVESPRPSAILRPAPCRAARGPGTRRVRRCSG